MITTATQSLLNTAPSNVAEVADFRQLLMPLARQGINASFLRRPPSPYSDLVHQLGAQELVIHYEPAPAVCMPALEETIEKAFKPLRDVERRLLDAMKADLLSTYETARALLQNPTLFSWAMRPGHGQVRWHVDYPATIVWCPSSTLRESTEIAADEDVDRARFYEELRRQAGQCNGGFFKGAPRSFVVENNWVVGVLGEIEPEPGPCEPFNVNGGCVHRSPTMRPGDVRVINTITTYKPPPFLRHKCSSALTMPAANV